MNALIGLNSIHLILFICFIIFICLIISALLPKKITCNKCSQKIKLNEFRYHYCEGIVKAIYRHKNNEAFKNIPGSNKIIFEFICPYCNDRREYPVYIKSNLLIPSVVTHFENCKKCKNDKLTTRII